MIQEFSGLLWKLALIALVCLSFYMIYLVRLGCYQAFHRMRVIKHQHFCIVEHLKYPPGLGVTKTLLERELKALDYRLPVMPVKSVEYRPPFKARKKWCCYRGVLMNY